MMMPRCWLSLLTSFTTASVPVTVSCSPWTMRPEAGQGARKVKSYMLAGRLAHMKPWISGRRIKSCIAIQAPKEKPATQQPLLFGLCCCIQSSALAASRSSPWPWSNTPWERPTPRKLKRSTEKPRRWYMWNML